MVFRSSKTLSKEDRKSEKRRKENKTCKNYKHINTPGGEEKSKESEGKIEQIELNLTKHKDKRQCNTQLE